MSFNKRETQNANMDLWLPDWGMCNRHTTLTFATRLWILLGMPGVCLAGDLFRPAVIYSVSDPVGIAIEDLDGDGDADFAVACSLMTYPGHVRIWLNDGDGTMHLQPVTYSAGPQAWDIAAGDLDGDGDADLVVVNLANDDVSVLLNNGDGTFADQVTYAVGDSPRTVAVEDLDGDGDADLAVVNFWSDNVSVLMNNGNGTFAPQVAYAVGHCPYYLAIDDLDGDGAADLAVGNNSSDNVSVLLNNGNGTFAGQVTYATGDSPHELAIEDLDGDGDADLAVVSPIPDNVVSVVLNNGDGTYADRATYAVGYGAHYVAAADLDCDGDADLAVGASGGYPDYIGSVSILLNNGDGTFADQITCESGPQRSDITAADLDDDGDTDLVSLTYWGDTLAIFFNRSADSPAELIGDLIIQVESLNLQHGIENSLDSKLDAAQQALDDVNNNNNVAAINALGAFINAVQAQSGVHIPVDDANALIAAAQQIIDALST